MFGSKEQSFLCSNQSPIKDGEEDVDDGDAH